MLDADALEQLFPLTSDSVRWHLPDDEYGDLDALEVTCQVIAATVSSAWTTVKERAAARRKSDPAMHRLLLNLRLDGLDAHPTGSVLSLYVASRGIHDLLHASTGARFAEALSTEARLSLTIADCDSRLRWTRGIPCHWVPPKPAPVEPDWEAIAAAEDAIIDGHTAHSDGPNAASNRLLLALHRRAGIRCGATWAEHPEGMVTLLCSPGDARRLMALGVPAMPQLSERGPSVGFTLTDQDCHTFTEKIIVVSIAGPSQAA
ncbi:hypothetical protein PV516_19640 [Streptomyces scabiei]|uniref:hypothetical protein n=1 Tax=Streptomyces scabiei TaxID=1930 RepID=UPI0029ABCB2B|nr:hypothetical protein [Streptomyces scabiei]MDX3166004.1 hypothetical protein [Streptomyces scabiei]